MNVEIHLLTASMFDEVCRIAGDAIAWKRKLLKETLYNKKSISYAALHDGQVVGFACVRLAKPSAMVPTIVVAETHRRNGIGIRLMNQIMHVAKHSHSTSIALKTASDNNIAINLYKKLGFDATGVIRDYYGAKRNAVVMSRML